MKSLTRTNKNIAIGGGFCVNAFSQCLENHNIDFESIITTTDLVEIMVEEKDFGKNVEVYWADLMAAFDVLRKEKLVDVVQKRKIPAF